MLQSKKVVSRGRNKQGGSASRILTAPVLAVAGWLTMILPSMAVTASYSNDYRVCAARLLSVGVTAQAASQGCATALRPRDLASCVVKIERQTQIAAADALSSCGQARRPNDLASCVVGISQNTQEAINPAVLTYCGRSLLPVTYAQCVVGLRSEIEELTPAQALDTCIDASDSVSGISSSTPPSRLPGGLNPTFDTTPVPTQPSVPVQPNIPTQPSVPVQPGTN
ncbi:hypothetical protein FNW02_28480 [Komarekiella sp. 'clone 1']|uniref:Uncharacterized protein n=1 Tax=Komarekiella delphini-convector SJRDD-AB1 TaxID=2593771 RepID=A0AA40VU08_9NOST|nr:hypothetical protein [Komarekiella delphini-convector]MBD6619652.1 hypothetical protein [Komarekiella delphini-convector SJRDD-AB1]